MKKSICLFFPFILFACGGNNAETSTENQDSTQLNSDTTGAEIAVLAETELPAKNGFTLYSEPYEVMEELATINSEYNKGQSISIVKTDQEEILMVVKFVNDSETESWYLGIDPVYGGMTSVRLEYMDANKDDVKDELVIWWEQYEGNNGMQSGYESENMGIVVIDVMNRNEMLNFVYSSHHASYSAGENANTAAPDYHAKMAEDSDWEICSFSHKLTLVNNDFQISDYYREVEGMGECVLRQFQDGTYSFNLTEEKFMLQP